ncbi:hypothetical protein BKA65DRAFT_115685 [Rhexocercosporidium sp. MPI-PUGE-AT-0058]|nr:hypothetical protein BKA65DRAFT_115685 [Rhexocercosporidium sp. MPI-PUGE-AT-0058]
MLSSILVLSLAAIATAVPQDPSNLFVRAKCNADNCARAVTGTQKGQTQTIVDRRADCSSFMQATVGPAGAASATVTVTVTSTAAPVFPHQNQVRQAPGADVTVVPSNVPAYASPCSGTVRYSSACSCAGFTATTTTLAVATATETVSVPFPFLATFYSETFFRGMRLVIDPTDRDQCIEAPESFARQASSVWWGAGQACYMFDAPGCSGSFARVDKTGAGGTNDDFSRLNPSFNKRMVSFRCNYL